MLRRAFLLAALGAAVLAAPAPAATDYLATGGSVFTSLRPTGIGLPQLGASGTVGAGDLPSALRTYHDGGQYDRDLADVAGAAQDYLDARLNGGDDGAASTSTPAPRPCAERRRRRRRSAPAARPARPAGRRRPTAAGTKCTTKYLRDQARQGQGRALPAQGHVPEAEDDRQALRRRQARDRPRHRRDLAVQLRRAGRVELLLDRHRDPRRGRDRHGDRPDARALQGRARPRRRGLLRHRPPVAHRRRDPEQPQVGRLQPGLGRPAVQAHRPGHRGLQVRRPRRDRGQGLRHPRSTSATRSPTSTAATPTARSSSPTPITSSRIDSHVAEEHNAAWPPVTSTKRSRSRTCSPRVTPTRSTSPACRTSSAPRSASTSSARTRSPRA